MRETGHHTDPLKCLEAGFRESPDAAFLSTPAGGLIHYGELERITRRVAAALRAQGVRKGDRLCVMVEKSVEAVFLYVSALRMGAVFVPLNTAFTTPELDYFLADAQPRLLIIDPAQAGAEMQACADRHSTRFLTLDAQGSGSFAQELERVVADPVAETHSAQDLAVLVYTSGTTGRSKGAMLSRANLAAGARALARAWQVGPQDVLLHVLPLFHVHGLFMALNTVLAARASILFVPRFDVQETCRLLPRATLFMGVPTHYTRLLASGEFDRTCAENIRLFISGSAPLLAETHREFESRCGHRILERYGMTETVVLASNPLHGMRKPGSVGLPLEGVEIRIAPLDGQMRANPGRGADGDIVEANPGAGAIEVRGPNVFSGYWRAPDKTRDSFTADGFFITGDVGRFDADGYLYIIGRARDLIITGGYNVYPVEVEEALDQLPGVAESAVIGLPHPDFGEGVTAVVVPEPGAGPGEAELIARLRETLAPYKLPKRILFIAELPRNTMGKVQKAALRAAYAGLYA